VAISGVALGLWSVATTAGVYFLGTSLNSNAGLLPRTLAAPRMFTHAEPLRHRDSVTRMAAVPEKTVRLAQAGAALASRMPGSAAPRRSFDQVVARAELSTDKLFAAFKRAGMAVAGIEQAAAERFDRETASAAAVALPPASERFGPRNWEIEASTHLALALIDLAPESQAVSVTEDDDADPASTRQPDQRVAEVATALEFEDVPDSAPRPGARPRTETRQPARAAASVPDKPAKPTRNPDETELAYARPDRLGGAGNAFRNLFSAPNRDSRTAVYDISAATVTLPDGQKLEAHSGIGQMADNPRFTHVKMRGPTPPDTYKLVMRETRFHGVEAIRLLPTDGKTKLGRTGLLAHTYLLRGKKAQSHGCVAFKDYSKFLAAFKKGKITRLIVVAGNSRRPTLVAQDGRDA
jgi:hypothetical protein